MLIEELRDLAIDTLEFARKVISVAVIEAFTGAATIGASSRFYSSVRIAIKLR